MKNGRICFFLLLPVLMGCMAHATEIGDFKTFTSKKGRFTVEFPGDPQSSDRDIDSAIGKLTAHVFLLHVGNIAEYSITYTDVPASITEAQKKAFNIDAALDGTRDGVARGAKARVVKESKIALDKWPGREWDLEGTGDANEDFRWGCYYVNTRQYQICVGWLKGHRPPDAIVDKFLNSLKILAES